MKVISSEKLPIKMWLNDIEEGALDQAKNLANLPFAYHHIAIMPDSHQGFGMPIGGVLATEGVIIPNAVGVDIGCGMLAVKTDLTDISTDQLKVLMSHIRTRIPVGFNHQKEKQPEVCMPDLDLIVASREYESALYQLGTLGGGNHFIEIQKGSDGFIWFMIHSGSRNIGLKVAKYYNELAIEINRKYYSSVPKSWELAFLPDNSLEGTFYRREMEYCVDFAYENRKMMAVQIKNAMFDTGLAPFIEGTEPELINIAHNYASLEHHFGKDVWVHRKGATLAREGTIGIIPGSQGTKSYIVRGLGNEDSFYSCSHGAGRKMSRTKARETLSLSDEQEKMQGVVHGIRSITDLDEAPGAYKDIQEVMANQTNLVEIVTELTPLAVIKG